jgi:putative Mn2+ efflux pump MntP
MINKMSNIIKILKGLSSKAVKLFGRFLIIGGIVGIFYIRFTHIDMTETRLLVEFWEYWLLIITIFILGGYLLITKSAFDKKIEKTIKKYESGIECTDFDKYDQKTSL